MKCSNCGKNVGKKDAFCPFCGKEIERPVVEKVKKPKKQIFRIIMMVIITMAALTSIILLVFLKKYDSSDFVEVMKSNGELMVICILTLFTPLVYIFVISVLGWIIIFFSNLFWIFISLLTMIKATKKKKLYLLFLIIVFIISTILIFALGINTKQL